MRGISGRMTGIILFAMFAVIAIADMVGFVPAYGDLQAYAAVFGLTNGAALFRLVAQTLMSLGIILAALATAYGLARRTTWAVKPARVLAFLFIIYGLFQVLTGFLMLKANQNSATSAGALYILIGVAVYSMVRRATAARD